MKIFKTLLLCFISSNIYAQSSDTTQHHPIDSATMYLTGAFKAYNPQKAFQIFMQRATSGEAKAMNAVALLYA